MAATVVLMNLKAHVYHLVASGIESARRLSEPVGPLARKVVLAHDENCLHGFFTAFNSCNIADATSILVFATAGNHKGTGTYARYFNKYPETMRTIVVVNLGLPDDLDSDRAVRRLAEFSFVSVFAVVDGKVKAVVQREPLSTPGGEINLWVSDFVKGDDVLELPGEFIRPLDYNGHVIFLIFSSTSSLPF
jgi:hypothetical protein